MELDRVIYNWGEGFQAIQDYGEEADKDTAEERALGVSGFVPTKVLVGETLVLEGPYASLTEGVF